MGQLAMRCSQCGSRIVEPPGTDQFECPFCEAITLLVPAEGSAAEVKRLKRDESVDLSRFTIDLDRQDLELSWGWDRLKGVAAILLAGVVGWFGSIYLPVAGSSHGRIDWIALLTGLGIIAVAIGLGYTGVALLFNSTRISIQNRVLQISHGPLPYYPRKVIPLASLQELRVHREVTKDSDGKTSSDWQLHACTSSGRTIRLIMDQGSSKVPARSKACSTPTFADCPRLPQHPSNSRNREPPGTNSGNVERSY